MLVNSHRHMEGLFDVLNGAPDIEQRAVGMLVGNGQAARSSEGDEGLIIHFRRSKLLRELFRRQILMVFRAGGVVEVVEKVGEGFLVAQGDRKSTRLNSSHLGI